MRRAIAGLAAVLLAGSAAWAGQMTPNSKDQPGPALQKAPAKSAMAEGKEVEGKVKSMDRSGKNVTLENGTKLTIPDSLKSARGALKKGAMIKATFEEKNGEKVATSIEVRSGESKPKS